MNFYDNLKNKNRKIYFSFDSALSASFMKMGAKLRGGGICWANKMFKIGVILKRIDSLSMVTIDSQGVHGLSDRLLETSYSAPKDFAYKIIILNSNKCLPSRRTIYLISLFYM